MLNTNNQNSILFKSMSLQQKLEDRRVFEQFMNKENHVTCDKPRGYLVKENAVQQLGSAFVDTFKDVGNLGKALSTGKSNDLELGRMNDVGMKIGGGLIAAALMGSKATSSKKLMELIGFGTFFSVMSLWPKVAIDAPTKMMHGFNPHQKYVDSQGRKKLFFQDNQYLPWDVWSNEEINKVADKMGVPKDLKDREEYTKEKMRTIALQDNTLWMLTAGFASPLLTSLACNKIESAIKVPVTQHDLKKINEQVGALDDVVATTLADTKVFGAQDQKFEEIIESLRKGSMPEDFEKKLSEIFDIASVVENPDVKNNIKASQIDDSRDLITRLFKANGNFEGSNFIKAIVGAGDSDDIKQAEQIFSRAYRELSSEGKGISWKSLIDKVADITADMDIDDKQWVASILEGFDGMPENLKAIAKAEGMGKVDFEGGIKALQEMYTGSVRPAQAQMRVFGQQLSSLGGIAGEKYNLVARTFLKELGLSDREIKQLRNSDESLGTIQEVLTKKLAAIAGDDQKYNALLEKLAKEEARIEGTPEAGIKGTLTSLVEKTRTALRTAGEKITGRLGDSKIRTTIIGKDTLGGVEAGLSSEAIERSKASITSVDSMITKIRSALELERKIGNGSLLEEWNNFAKANGTIGEIGEDAAEDFYNLCRKISWQSTYGDAMNKYYLEGNGGLFKALTDTVFADTEGVDFVTALRQKAKSIANETGYIPNEALQIRTKDAIGDYAAEIGKPHGVKFADYGESLLGTLKKQINQVYNDKTWMKKFGGLTIALVGATFISQLFFGKVKNAHLYKKEPQNLQQDTFQKR